MLYSRQHDLAFAHYPKTAGNSIGEWFRMSFDDAFLLDPIPDYNISHLPVRVSLERLRLLKSSSPFFPPFMNHLTHLFRPSNLPTFQRCSTRIIGVVREPFEMLVSLYEFCRHYPFKIPLNPFIKSARDGTFPEFVHMAVVQRCLPSYDFFFDVGGPAWALTRLIDFDYLSCGLSEVCTEFGIAGPTNLPHRNVGPRPNRDLRPYKQALGTLASDVENYYHWYYTQRSSGLFRPTSIC